jgi:hypothetical protein
MLLYISFGFLTEILENELPGFQKSEGVNHQ